MMYSTVVATLLISSVMALEQLAAGPFLFPRQGQAFTPGRDVMFGTCASNGQVNCGTGLCVDIRNGQICCDPASEWGCPRNSFCLINGKCCPNGLDPKTCASQQGITLPDGYTTKAPVDPSRLTQASSSVRATTRATSAAASSAKTSAVTPTTTSRSSGGGVGVDQSSKASPPTFTYNGTVPKPSVNARPPTFMGAAGRHDVVGAAVVAFVGAAAAVVAAL